MDPLRLYTYAFCCKPKSAFAAERVSRRKKITWLAAAVALWVFTLGILPLVCWKLHSLRLSNKSVKFNPPESARQTAQVGGKILEPKQEPMPTTPTKSSNLPSLAEEEIQSKLEKLNELTLDQLSELGGCLSVERLLKIDLKHLKKERKERFYALFGIAEDLAKGREVISKTPWKTILLHSDLFLSLKDILGPTFSCCNDHHLPTVEKNASLSPEDCLYIEATLSDNEMRRFFSLPFEIDAEALKALLKTQAEEGVEPRGKRLISSTGDSSFFVRFLHLFSEEHWKYVDETGLEMIFYEFTMGSFSNDKTLQGIADHYINNGSIDEAKKIIKKIGDEFQNGVAAEAYQTIIVEIFPFLKEEFKPLVPQDERPISLEEYKREHNGDFGLVSRVPRKEKAAFLSYFFNALEPTKAKAEFQKLSLKDYLPYLSNEHIAWASEEQVSCLNFSWAKHLEFPMAKDLTFQKNLNHLLCKYPEITKKLLSDEKTEFSLVFDFLCKEIWMSLSVDGLKADFLQKIFPRLTIDQIHSITKEQFQQLTLSPPREKKYAESFGKNLNVLLDQFSHQVLEKFKKITCFDSLFPFLNEKWRIAALSSSFDRALDLETRYSTKVFTKVFIPLSQLTSNEVLSISKDQFLKINLFSPVSDPESQLSQAEKQSLRKNLNALFNRYPEDAKEKLTETLNHIYTTDGGSYCLVFLFLLLDERWKKLISIQKLKNITSYFPYLNADQLNSVRLEQLGENFLLAIATSKYTRLKYDQKAKKSLRENLIWLFKRFPERMNQELNQLKNASLEKRIQELLS